MFIHFIRKQHVKCGPPADRLDCRISINGLTALWWHNGQHSACFTANMATRVMLRGFWRCDFPSLASRRCSSKTVYFVIITKNVIKNNIPLEGINIYIHIYIASVILLSIHNEINTYVFMINNYKTIYEYDSLSSLLNSL